MRSDALEVAVEDAATPGDLDVETEGSRGGAITRLALLVVLLGAATTAPAPASEELWHSRMDAASEVLRSQGPAAALPQFEAALEAARSEGDETGEAAVLTWLGQVHGRRGDYPEASRVLDRAMQIYRRVSDDLGETHPSLLAVLGNRAIVARRTGDLDLAESLLTEQVALSGGAPPPRQASAWNNLGSVHFDRGELEDAERAFERAYTLRRDAGDHERLHIPLTNLANISSLLGETEEARQRYLEAGKLKREASDKAGFEVWLRNYASFELELGNTEAAAGAIREAIEHVERSGEAHAEAAILQIEAELRLAHGEATAAAELAEKAANAAQQQGDPRTELLSLQTLGRAALELGEADAARRHATTALTLARRSGFEGQRWQTLWLLGLADQERASADTVPSEPLPDALGFFRASVDALERYRDTQLPEGFRRRGFLDSRRRPYEGLVMELVARGRAFEALQIAERSKAQTLLELLEHDRPADEPRVAAAIDETLLADLLGDRLLRSYFVGEHGVRIAEGRLDEEGGVEVAWYFRAIDRQELRNRVHAFRDALADRSLGYRAAAAALGELLIPDDRPGSPAREILLLPDDALWQLPWSALERNGRPLLDGPPLLLAPSLEVWADLLTTSGPSSSDAWTWAGDRPWPPEVPQALQLRTEADLASPALERARVAHFAGHGTFLAHAPLRSRIVLSLVEEADTESDPSSRPPHLVAEDLLSRNLSAELLTFAACETGRGPVSAGEGVAGFVWATLRAGASNVLATLWRVDAAATDTTVRGLYAELVGARDDDVPLATAMQRAARATRSRPGFEHPFYWAGWQLVGDGAYRTTPFDVTERGGG